jgi:hypothetical protein
MKRTETFILIFISMFILLSAQSVSAQERTVVPEGYVLVDSVVYRPAHAVDTTLAGQDIFRVVKAVTVPGKADVVVNQTPAVEASMRRQVQSNKERTMSGYRVRIFFDNKQTARVESEETLKKFERLYHDVVAYRTYANPYFKVTVGDFRTRSVAVKLLERIRHDFPSAFVVKENISFPVVDKENAYVVDTVKVLRPVTVSL